MQLSLAENQTKREKNFSRFVFTIVSRAFYNVNYSFLQELKQATHIAALSRYG